MALNSPDRDFCCADGCSDERRPRSGKNPVKSDWNPSPDVVPGRRWPARRRQSSCCCIAPRPSLIRDWRLGMFVRCTRRTSPNLRACLRIPSRNGMRSTVGPGAVWPRRAAKFLWRAVSAGIRSMRLRAWTAARTSRRCSGVASLPFAVNEGDTGSNPVAHPNSIVCLTLHFGGCVDGAHRPHDSRDAHCANPATGVQSQTIDHLSDSSAGEHPVDNREVTRSNRVPTTNGALAQPAGQCIVDAQARGSTPLRPANSGSVAQRRARGS